jgi:hypothetical protein
LWVLAFNPPSTNRQTGSITQGARRILAALSPKVIVTVLGDAGAGGANLDYQVGGALGYKLKPNIILQGGCRYLNVDYRPSSGFVYDTATSGVLIGATSTGATNRWSFKPELGYSQRWGKRIVDGSPESGSLPPIMTSDRARCSIPGPGLKRKSRWQPLKDT